MSDTKYLADRIARVQQSLLRHMAEAYGLLSELGSLHAELVAHEERAKPGCPKCGSPKIDDLSGMGVPEFRCRDCGSSWGS